MVIDTHLHFGKRGPFDLNMDVLLRQMDQNGIDIGLVSTVVCAEYRPDTPVLLPDPVPQLDANRILLKQCRESNGRLFLSFWCKPATESADGVYEFIRDNRNLVKGIKLHPFYSRLPLEDERYVPYIEIAQELDLPISVHTAADRLSSPEQLLDMAKRHPKAKFIMVHMGLCSDNEEAIRCVAKRDNLWGDTTWVPLNKVQKALRVCGRDKILFGSDAPIDGEKSYDFYTQMLQLYRRNPVGVWGDVMYNNAQRLFALKQAD